jgi:hypothetical protein
MIIFFAFLVSVHGQNQITSQSLSIPTSLTYPAGFNFSDSSNSSVCVTGTLFGQFLLSVPNATSIFVSSNFINMTWAYSTEVTNIPMTVDIKYATVSQAQAQRWTKIDTISGSQTYYCIFLQFISLDWQVPPAATDKFLIRLVPDQKETIVTGFIGSPPCFRDGDILPTNSPPFQIVTNVACK